MASARRSAMNCAVEAFDSRGAFEATPCNPVTSRCFPAPRGEIENPLCGIRIARERAETGGRHRRGGGNHRVIEEEIVRIREAEAVVPEYRAAHTRD